MSVLTPWFADREGVVLLYKVNRRPLPEHLFSDQRPQDVMQHLVEVLPFGAEVQTGTTARRVWRLGNRESDARGGLLVGQIGWERVEGEVVDAYDSTLQRWVDDYQPIGHSARSVFAFNPTNRFLAVAQHPSFRETTLANVFSALLNMGEAERAAPTTDWAVEPILDEVEFTRWLASVSRVDKVRFVAKLPNPGGMDEFAELWSRLELMNASSIDETITARQGSVGIVNVAEDRQSSQFIAMAASAFGYVTASGQQGDHTARFDQRRQVKKVHIQYPPTWEDLIDLVVAVAHDPSRYYD